MFDTIMWILLVVFVLSAPTGLVLALLAFRRSGRVELELKRMQGLAIREKVVPMQDVEHEPTAPIVQTLTKAEGPTKTIDVAPVRRWATMDFEAILGGQWLTWTGILALFFGTAFFLGVDLQNNPMAGYPQVLIGLVAALLFMYVGHRLYFRTERFLGLGLLGGGLALLYLTMFAAYGFHHLLPLVVVMPLLLVVAALGSMLALHRNSLTIASLNLIGSLITPLILVDIANTHSAFDSLLPYLVAVNLGAILVGLRRGWAGLPFGAFLATVFLVIVWWEENPRTDLFAFFSVAGSWLVFAAGPWMLQNKNRFWSLARAAVLSANGLFFSLFCYQMLEDVGQSAQGFALMALAIIYYLTSKQMKSRKGENPATRLSLSTAAALAALAVPVLLDVAWITLGWTLLAGVLIMAGLREHDLWQRLSGLAILVVGLFRVIFIDIPVAPHQINGFTPMMNGDFLGGLVTILLVGWTFWAYHRYEDRLHKNEIRLRSTLLVLGSLTMLWKLSFEIVGYFEWRRLSQGQLMEAVVWLRLFGLWSVYGLAMWFVGQRKNYLPLRGSGYLVLGGALLGTTLVSFINGPSMVENYHAMLNLPFMQGLILSGALACLAWRGQKSKTGLTAFENKLQTPLVVAAVLVLFLKISLEVLAFFKFGGMSAAGNFEVRSQLGLSLVWGLYSGIVIWIGFAKGFKTARLLGMSLLGLTVLKVFLLDIGALERGYRIAAFIALGVILLGVSVLYQRDRRARKGASS